MTKAKSTETWADRTIEKSIVEVGRTPNTPCSEVLAARTAQAREDIAAQLYDRASVIAALQERALGGWSFLRLDPGVPITLKETSAAKALETWLSAESLRFKWVQATRNLDDRRNKEGEAIKYEVLRIEW